jgi:hypothetical protein
MRHMSALSRAYMHMRKMFKETLSKIPNLAFCNVASQYHQVMLTCFPKFTLRIYEHALLAHVPDMLKEGPRGRALLYAAHSSSSWRRFSTFGKTPFITQKTWVEGIRQVMICRMACSLRVEGDAGR